MRAITLMYDSLNRNYLPNFGDAKTIAPNFQRLAEKTVTFDNFYVGSLPCMPARRELHTGRYNFLFRNWGPLEPFDDSMPKLLSDAGVYTHCVTDHVHYWELGGGGYLEMFSSCERVRGQEGDAWYGRADGFTKNGDQRRQDVINRENMPEEKDHFHVRSYEAGMKFLKDNAASDNWYLHLEYFDPHEPMFVPQKYRDMYPDGDDALQDWPRYGRVEEGDEEMRQARVNYRALVTMCDEYLGKVLDFMDEHDMWKDTMLIVNTDHGHLLGENGWYGKNYMPIYDQIAHTPFFIWDPRYGKAGERRQQLAQTIDIAPTLLEYFGVERPATMLGKPISPIVSEGRKTRDHALFGHFGKHVNITDGRHVYMRSGRSLEPGMLYEYTLMPQHIFSYYSIDELKAAERTLVDSLPVTKGAPVLKVPATSKSAPTNTCLMYEMHMEFGDLLFDLEKDPGQTAPLDDAAKTRELTEAMQTILKENGAPPELYKRLDIGG